MKGLIFTAESVKAILAGKKTQTRRLVKFPRGVDDPAAIEFDRWQDGYPDGARPVWFYGEEPFSKKLPLCVGDVVYVKETWSGTGVVSPIVYRDGGDGGIGSAPWRSPMMMPEWASRLRLRITDVRVEKASDISEEDAKVKRILILSAVVMVMLGCGLSASENASCPTTRPAMCVTRAGCGYTPGCTPKSIVPYVSECEVCEAP